MKNSLAFTLLVAAVVSTTACSKKSADSPTPSGSITETIEVLDHKEGKFTTTETITLSPGSNTFQLGGNDFVITARWPHAEASKQTIDKNNKETHAIEVAEIRKHDKPGAETAQWIYQSDRPEAATTLEGLNCTVRVAAPGSRPAIANTDGTASPENAQFSRQGQLIDLPQVGAAVFDGWNIKEVITYQHALLDDNSDIIESEDTSFTNRALKVFITDAHGSEERHIVFLDHPELTKGIHPQVLPVARVSGTQASNSRLIACASIQPPAHQHLLLIAPVSPAKESALTAWLWKVGAPAPELFQLASLPADVQIDEKNSLQILRHFTHAQPLVKWEQKASPTDGEPHPALVIKHSASNHHDQEFVLLLEKMTPCRLGDNHLILKYSQPAE